MATKLKAVRVGLLGESPNDTEAIKVLLQQRYAARITCFPLLERLTGGTLDSQKILRSLPIACDRKRPDIVVVIRDLDALASNAEQMRQRQAYFTRINQQVGGTALYLLHIYEFEALIAADIRTFNALYKSACKITGDPTRLIDPKRYCSKQPAKALVANTTKTTVRPSAPSSTTPSYSTTAATSATSTRLLRRS